MVLFKASSSNDVQGCFDIEIIDGNELERIACRCRRNPFDLLLLDIEMPIQRFSVGAVFDPNGEASFGGICHEAA